MSRLQASANLLVFLLRAGNFAWIADRDRAREGVDMLDAAAAYIEILQRQAAPPTVKQHMAAIRMLFSWLTEKGVLAMKPAREVKTETATLQKYVLFQ
jgi:site-specific recombinase XerD